ncbi:hypothetical protein Tco_0906786 [Tanacetum coccineum]|uniref:MAK10-like protein n=1 Tax=Tanacetum coccineum TaxID=301880 RepID=A0ABQ5CHF3_9ASTR
MGGSYYSFPFSILSTRKDYKTSRTIDQSAGGKLSDRNVKESWALLEDLTLYDNESQNDLRDFAKPVKAISLPHDVPMNKITSACEICSGPHDTQYCMENLKQACVDYASSRNNELGVFFEKLDDTSTRDTAKDFMAHVNAASTDQIEKEELRSKGIKSPSKLLSPKYFPEAKESKPLIIKMRPFHQFCHHSM